MRQSRQTSGIDDRLEDCYYRRIGKYHPTREAQLRQADEPVVYAQLTSVKARTVAAFLRDIYTAGDRPWTIQPTPVPDLPEDAERHIAELVAAEVRALMAEGRMVDPELIERRIRELIRMTEEGALRKGREEARAAARRLEDILVEGGFYTALVDVIEDFVTYPYAVLKGPVVRHRPRLVWRRRPDGGVIVDIDTTATQLTWERVDPRNVWWTPGVAQPEVADWCEILRYTPARFETFRYVQGFDPEAIAYVIDRYGESGFQFSRTQAFQTDEERTADDNMGDQPIIEVLEFTGRLFGRTLERHQERIAGFEPTTSYFVRAWIVDNIVLRLDLEPNPLLRPPYYVAQFAPIPGSMYGLALPELLSDMQDAMNSVLRAVIRNATIASGPQVGVDMAQLTDPNDVKLRPWKVWLFDSMQTPGSSSSPITFFDPSTKVGDLTMLMQMFATLAEDNSAIPRYLTGYGRIGGAGRTASGLAMLMDNAHKVLQTIAQTIDLKLLKPALSMLYTLLVYTQPDIFRGDLRIEVKGAIYLKQKEVDRARLLEFLNMTSNPVDINLIGLEGRAAILKRLMEDLKLEGEPVDPEAAVRAMAALSNIRPGPAPAQRRNDGTVAAPQTGIETVSGIEGVS